MQALLSALLDMPAADRQPDASNPEAEYLRAEVQRFRDDNELLKAHGDDLRIQLNRCRGECETLRGELARANAEIERWKQAAQAGDRSHNQ